MGRQRQGQFRNEKVHVSCAGACASATHMHTSQFVTAITPTTQCMSPGVVQLQPKETKQDHLGHHMHQCMHRLETNALGDNDRGSF